MLREASWSRSNSSWGISQFKRPNDILAASSGFDQRSMTKSVSSRILEIAEGLPNNRTQSDSQMPSSTEKMKCGITSFKGEVMLQRTNKVNASEETIKIGPLG